MDKIAKKVAEMLLDIEAIKLRPQEPFRWASGWFSPIYCDNRMVLSFPKVRDYIKKSFVETSKAHFADAQLIAGVATAGIAHGALLADALNLPFAYVRPKAKEHGMGNLIEGKIEAGQKVVVVEDLISTGGSSLKAVEAIRAAGAEVLGMVAIFSYNFPIADQNFQNAQVPLVTLSNYQNLIVQAVDKEIITEEMMASLQEWRVAPEKWNQPKE